jgi:hypothetical protein
MKTGKAYIIICYTHQYYSVDPTGVVLNFILEDFDAVLKFMDVELQKKKRKL